MNEGSGNGEVYRFMNMEFDIDAAYELIKTSHLKPTKTNIKPFAETYLHLDRNKPEEKPHSIWHSIDYDFLKNIPDDRLNEPGIIATVRTPKTGKIFHLVIDGNHRLAANYMKGIDKIDMFILDEELTAKIMF